MVAAAQGVGLQAMRRAANSFALLADAALDELPSTMTAVRLSGMEISDFTLELSDLSQVIADGVNKSTNIVQAVEDGIGQMRNIARQKTKWPAKSLNDSSSQYIDGRRNDQSSVKSISTLFTKRDDSLRQMAHKTAFGWEVNA
uniref:Uncharacterized protein n=1 Tax=Aegilops tauschii TaxID=37682 RepID=M8BLQ7_AEGTA